MTEARLKRCSDCKQRKDRSQFYKNRSRKDGLQYKCKQCYNDYNLKRRQRGNAPPLKKKPPSYQKGCRRCHKEMTAAHFHRHTRQPDGLTRLCQACHADIAKQHRRAA